METSLNIEQYLIPGKFTDSDSETVREYAIKNAGDQKDDVGRAVKLYYAVRDGFRYNPYKIDLRPSGLKASNLIGRDHGYCVEKANLLAAAARALGIPSRIGLVDVMNHIAAERFEKILQTKVLAFHGYTELFLNGKWVKSTPSFNKELCYKLKVDPLEFNGIQDSIFQQYTPDGEIYMEYLHDHGQFADIPYDFFVNGLKNYYSHLFKMEKLSPDQYFIVE